MSEILCSTGAIIGRRNGRNFHLLPELAAQINCDGFELMMYMDWYEKTEELVHMLKEEKLYIPVMHCEKFIGEKIGNGDFELAFKQFEVNCQIAQQIGASKMVLHLWNGMISDNHFENNIKAYPNLEEIATRYAIDLLIENVVCNREDPMSHWCELRRIYPKIHFIYDTKMAQFHDQESLLYEKEYEWLWKEDHIHHYHVNDYAGGYMDWSNLNVLPVGTGGINFQRFFQFIDKIGYRETFTLEAPGMREDGSVDIAMLNKQIADVRQLLTKYVK
ncbi:MAG: TIM barrel protein [Clostridiales bacterium]|nr:TIM barrel protein [Clostridiales bacterium]